MYIFPEMINMGLRDGEQWVSDDHKVVAQHICLCNNRVTNRDSLMDMVSAIQKIPQDKIRLVTLIDLAEVYNVPFLSLS